MFPIRNPLLLFLRLSMRLKLPIIQQNGKFSAQQIRVNRADTIACLVKNNTPLYCE